jgi:hypothetical protein
MEQAVSRRQSADKLPAQVGQRHLLRKVAAEDRLTPLVEKASESVADDGRLKHAEMFYVDLADVQFVPGHVSPETWVTRSLL